jgi:hypothetical protein
MRFGRQKVARSAPLVTPTSPPAVVPAMTLDRRPLLPNQRSPLSP